MADISRMTWHGFAGLALQSELMRVVTIPELGAKMVSMIDKVRGQEWLVPPIRPLKQARYGAEFVSQDMSGWDEMFPTIVACNYPGTGERHGMALPDHGEVWTLPWKVEQASAGKLILSVDGPALPYHLTRIMEWTAPTVLQLSYQLDNPGSNRMPYMWAAHPQFVCKPGTEIIFPPQVTEVCNVIGEDWGWGPMETRYDWPEAVAPSGQRVRIDRIGPASLHLARKFFVLPDVQAGWAGVVRPDAKDWLRMEWDAKLVPYLGLWVDEGAISTEAVAAPEPMTGFYDSLEVAWNKKRVAMIEPGASQNWALTLRFGAGNQPFPGE